MRKIFFEETDFSGKGLDIYTNEPVEGNLLYTDFGIAIEEKIPNETNIFKEKNSFFFKTKIHFINEDTVCKKFPIKNYNLYAGDVIYLNFSKLTEKVFKNYTSGYYILIYDFFYGWGFEQISYKNEKEITFLHNTLDPFNILNNFKESDIVIKENYVLRKKGERK